MLRKCSSCEDLFAVFRCESCRAKVANRCEACHNELAHGVLPDLELLGSKRGGSSRHLSDEQYHGENSRGNR